MKNQKKKAFTLAELLVVVLIVGVLSTVAVPKMKSVIETRRTTEAEDIMTAVRTEQEKRCVLGKQYLMDSSKVDALANASNSTNYSYALDTTGIVAQSKGKDYNLQIRSYRTGEICCQGEYCASLNKNYPSCDSIAALTDECAGVAPNDPPQEPEIPEPTPEPEDDCITNPNQEKCCDEGEEWNGSECVTPTTPEPEDDCITNPNQEKCCDEGEEWDGSKCVTPEEEPEEGPCKDPKPEDEFTPCSGNTCGPGLTKPYVCDEETGIWKLSSYSAWSGRCEQKPIEACEPCQTGGCNQWHYTCIDNAWVKSEDGCPTCKQEAENFYKQIAAPKIRGANFSCDDWKNWPNTHPDVQTLNNWIANTLPANVKSEYGNTYKDWSSRGDVGCAANGQVYYACMLGTAITNCSGNSVVNNSLSNRFEYVAVPCQKITCSCTYSK